MYVPAQPGENDYLLVWGGREAEARMRNLDENYQLQRKLERKLKDPMKLGDLRRYPARWKKVRTHLWPYEQEILVERCH